MKRYERHLKILIVEDDPIVRIVTNKMIEELGYQSECAINGIQALHLIQQNHYNVIFMDIGLPDIDGITVTEKIRQYERENNFLPSRIFALTAYSLIDIKDKCLMAGMNEVHTKPISPQVLKSLISNSYGTISAN